MRRPVSRSTLAQAWSLSRSSESKSEASPRLCMFIRHLRCAQARAAFSAVMAPETSVRMAVLTGMNTQQKMRELRVESSGHHSRLSAVIQLK